MFKWHPFRWNLRRLLLKPLYHPFLKFFLFELRYLGIQGPSTHNANVGPSETFVLPPRECVPERRRGRSLSHANTRFHAIVAAEDTLRTRCTLCPWRCWTILNTTLICAVTSLGSWRRPLMAVDTAVMMPRWSDGSSRNRVTLWREAIGWWVIEAPVWTPMRLL